MSIVEMIIGYEQGELSDDEMIALFAELIRTGMAWSLQGHYGRTAAALIEGGYITPEGCMHAPDSAY